MTNLIEALTRTDYGKGLLGIIRLSCGATSPTDKSKDEMITQLPRQELLRLYLLSKGSGADPSDLITAVFQLISPGEKVQPMIQSTAIITDVHDSRDDDGNGALSVTLCLTDNGQAEAYKALQGLDRVTIAIGEKKDTSFMKYRKRNQNLTNAGMRWVEPDNLPNKTPDRTGELYTQSTVHWTNAGKIPPLTGVGYQTGGELNPPLPPGYKALIRRGGYPPTIIDVINDRIVAVDKTKVFQNFTNVDHAEFWALKMIEDYKFLNIDAPGNPLYLGCHLQYDPQDNVYRLWDTVHGDAPDTIVHIFHRMVIGKASEAEVLRMIGKSLTEYIPEYEKETIKVPQ